MSYAMTVRLCAPTDHSSCNCKKWLENLYYVYVSLFTSRATILNGYRKNNRRHLEFML
jgi:hypothetical protein